MTCSGEGRGAASCSGSDFQDTGRLFRAAVLLLTRHLDCTALTISGGCFPFLPSYRNVGRTVKCESSTLASVQSMRLTCSADAPVAGRLLALSRLIPIGIVLAVHGGCNMPVRIDRSLSDSYSGNGDAVFMLNDIGGRPAPQVDYALDVGNTEADVYLISTNT